MCKLLYKEFLNFKQADCGQFVMVSEYNHGIYLTIYDGDGTVNISFHFPIGSDEFDDALANNVLRVAALKAALAAVRKRLDPKYEELKRKHERFRSVADDMVMP